MLWIRGLLSRPARMTNSWKKTPSLHNWQSGKSPDPMTATSLSQPFNEQQVQLSDELGVYFKNKFSSTGAAPTDSLHLDEPSVKSWKAYDTANAFDLLTRCYPQLCFPIEEGINKTQPYIDAVLKGKTPGINGNYTLGLNNPGAIKIKLHKSMAGVIPVLMVTDNQDFVKITQCLLHKNNPAAIPQSMGAFLANGIVNWNRLHTLEKNWIPGSSAETWNQEFAKNVLPVPGLYKDRIIVLSMKPYSNVSADALNLVEDDWLIHSLAIRLEHECTHLYTLKRYGCAANNLHDELIADYVGISKALGKYSKEWMLAFMGLEAYPNYRQGARLENYVGNATLNPEDFRLLTEAVKSAIETISRFDAALGVIDSETDQLCRADALCVTDLLKIASTDGFDSLMQKYNELYFKALVANP